MAEQKRLRIYGIGDFDAEVTAIFFSRIVEAYYSLHHLENCIDYFEGNNDKYFFARNVIITDLLPKGMHVEDRLRLVAVEFHSPGFWEFIGNCNPLNVLRQYLNDQHEREKDFDYRNYEEQRKLAIANDSGETENAHRRLELIDKYIATCRSANVPENIIQANVIEHATSPLKRLDSVASYGLITHSEFTDEEKEYT